MKRSPAKAPVARATPRAQAAYIPHDSYPLKTVSRLTGLSADLIRAWERRYSVVAPERGPRGARLYSGDDVARLRQLGALVRSGRSIGDVARIEPGDLRSLAESASIEPGAEARPDRAQQPGAAREQVDRVLTAIQAFDQIAVEGLLGESLFALGTSGFVLNVGAPLLERIGELWEKGEFSVAEEHIASTTIRSLFGGLLRMRMPATPPRLFLTAPSGERHELGLSMVALLCVQAGLAVAYAGVDLPAGDIVTAAVRSKVMVVGLSLVAGTNRKQAVDEVRRIEAQLPRHVEIWLGGRDASAVAQALGKTRAIVLGDVPAIEREIFRIASLGA